jgi:hypothetical protein
VSHHFQAVVAEQVLEGENIPAVSEVIDRKGVAKLVGVGLDPKLLPKFGDE